jgi:hypothetical protein
MPEELLVYKEDWDLVCEVAAQENLNPEVFFKKLLTKNVKGGKHPIVNSSKPKQIRYGEPEKEGQKAGGRTSR